MVNNKINLNYMKPFMDFVSKRKKKLVLKYDSSNGKFSFLFRLEFQTHNLWIIRIGVFNENFKFKSTFFTIKKS
jgi:hypothetical protein